MQPKVLGRLFDGTLVESLGGTGGGSETYRVTATTGHVLVFDSMPQLRAYLVHLLAADDSDVPALATGS